MVLSESLALLSLVWLLTVTAASLADALRPDVGHFIALSIAAGAVLWFRPATWPWIDTRASALAFSWIAGFSGYAALLYLIVVLGLSIGLEPQPASVAGPPSAWQVAKWLIVAPVLEELLYRERLYSALRPYVGSAMAVATSSLAFALPHPGVWGLLGALVVGGTLSGIYVISGSILLCIGFHVGLNAASLSGGLSVGHQDGMLALGAAVAAVALFAAIRSARRRSDRKGLVHA